MSATNCLMPSISFEVCSAAPSMSAVGLRSPYAASSTPPFRTNLLLSEERESRSRNPSSAYSLRYSAVVRLSDLASLCNDRKAHPLTVSFVGLTISSSSCRASGLAAGDVRHDGALQQHLQSVQQ
jgi:hypothetical protein